MSETSLTSPKTRRLQLKRALTFLIRPRQVYEELTAEKGTPWLLPMLLLSLGLILRVLVAGYLRTRAAALGELTLPPDWEWWSPEMQNNYLQGIQTTQGPAYVFVIPAVTGLMGLWLGWPILSSMLHLTSTLLGGRGSQAKTLSVVAWSYLPYALRDILRAGYMLVVKHVILSPGLSGFAPSGASAFISNLLQGFDLFLVWQALLMVLGLSQLNGLSRPKTWLAVLLVLLVSILALAGLSSFFASLSGSVVSRPFYF